MSKLNHQTSQDYLKTIYLLGQAEPSRRIQTGEIATRLGLRAASVTGMLGRLAADGMVDYEKRRGVTLTAAGEKIALEMVRRHRLIETFLFEKLGYRWDELHEEAERLEHAVTAPFCRRLDDILGYPTRDPHGAPIPNPDLDRPIVTATSLSVLEPGSRAIIMRLSDRDGALLKAAAAQHLFPGTFVEIQADSPVTLLRRGENHPQIIAPSLGKIIYVEIV